MTTELSKALGVGVKDTSLALVSEKELIEVLQTSLYPGAAPQSIKMVMSYCKAAGYDPLQKPVHIVPMWDSKARQMRDVVMPGIGLYRIQAARTGEHVGTDEPVFGPLVDVNVGELVIKVPEWCSVTVWRFKHGEKCAFTATEYWMENYATAGKDSSAPNTMWKKRSRGQLAKCAEAQALRKGFPEVGSAPTAEEMEGKYIETFEHDITPKPQRENAIAIAQAAMATDDTEQREQLIADLDAVADNGMAALKAAWDKLTPEQRKLHGGLSNSTKDRANRADEFGEQAE